MRAHLSAEYEGVFDERALDSFVETYVGLGAATAQVDQLVGAHPDATRVLDIGSGYGSFVLAARERGIDAVGLEPQQFELEFARARLAGVRPTDDPSRVYLKGDGRALPFERSSFDAVTLWNVVEHVRDLEPLIDEAARVLANGGVLMLVCPNYAAIRREAHYQVPWVPMPRRVASWYLSKLGRDSSFFDDGIHYRTPWELARAFRRADLDVLRRPPRQLEKIDAPGEINRATVRMGVQAINALHLDGVLRGAIRAIQSNPFRRTIDIVATKR